MLIGLQSFLITSFFNVLQITDSTPYGVHPVYVVSGLNRENVIEINVSHTGNSDCLLDFSILHVKESFISTDLTDFSLQVANYLYIGAIYQNTAHIAHIFGSSDPHHCNGCSSALDQKHVLRL